MARKWHGTKWIRPEKRLALYLRDGMACAYCGATVEDGAMLTLDHVKPHSKGGDNSAGNLVTCCKRCNSSRGNRSLAAFCRGVAEYLNHGCTAEQIEAHVHNCRRRKPDMKAAARMAARRGKYTVNE